MSILPAHGAAAIPAEYDIVIIGAGPAGIAVALELSGTSLRCLLLESGDSGPDDDLNEAVTDSLLGDSCRSGRARGVGGTSRLWAGQLLPLSQSELAVQPSNGVPGWPLQPGDLKPYWRRAEAFFGTIDVGYDESSWPTSEPRPPSFGRGWDFRFSQFLRQPDMGARHRDALAAARNVTVVTGATVVRLDPAAQATDVIAATPPGRRTFSARHVVLACGAIETPRLLLASGMDLRMVGRCFMEHVGVAIPVEPHGRQLTRMLSSRTARDRRLMPRIVKLPATRGTTPHTGIGGARRLARRSPLPALKTLRDAIRQPTSLADRNRARAAASAAAVAAREAPEILRAGAGMWRHGHKFAEGVGNLALGIGTEVLPRPENRIVLDESRCDRLGVPLPKIEFRVDEEEWHAIRDTASETADHLHRFALGWVDVTRLPQRADDAVRRGLVVPALHHMGTARMALDPQWGVVDTQCRIHVQQNIHVAGAAVFPTGGLSNPTLTLVALSIRVADNLKLMNP